MVDSTGDPWYLPYSEADDRADDPSQSRAHAVKVHDSLTGVQAGVDAVDARVNATNANLATTNQNVTNLSTSIPGQVNSGIAAYVQPQSHVTSGAYAPIPSAWTLMPFTTYQWGNPGVGSISGGRLVVATAGLYLVIAYGEFHPMETTAPTNCYLSVENLPLYATARGATSYGVRLNASCLARLSAGFALGVLAQAFGALGSSNRVDQVGLFAVRLGA